MAIKILCAQRNDPNTLLTQEMAIKMRCTQRYDNSGHSCDLKKININT